jgi:hypothetical protein
MERVQHTSLSAASRSSRFITGGLTTRTRGLTAYLTSLNWINLSLSKLASSDSLVWSSVFLETAVLYFVSIYTHEEGIAGNLTSGLVGSACRRHFEVV